MSPEQCRAARAWLEWSMDDLATRAHVSNSTIRDYEAGRRTPIQNNLDAIRRALESEGIVFTGEAGGTMSVAGKAREPRTAEKDAAPVTRKRKATRTKRR